MFLRFPEMNHQVKDSWIDKNLLVGHLYTETGLTEFDFLKGYYHSKNQNEVNVLYVYVPF